MSQIREKEIIELFKINGLPDMKIILGIGDDCAVIEKSATHYMLISKDLLLEDVHFRLATTNPTALAHKLINCNLSDIAACGGTPLYILLGVSCLLNTKKNWLEEFALSIKNICQRQ